MESPQISGARGGKIRRLGTLKSVRCMVARSVRAVEDLPAGSSDFELQRASVKGRLAQVLADLIKGSALEDRILKLERANAMRGRREPVDQPGVQ